MDVCKKKPLNTKAVSIAVEMNSKADKKTILQRNFFWKFPLPPPLSRKKIET